MVRNLRIANVLLGLLIVSSCSGMGLFSGAESEFEQGLALFNRGRYEEAIPHFERAIDKDPDFAQAHLYSGRSHLSLGRWRRAVPPLRTAYRLAPEATKREVLDFLVDALLGVAVSDSREKSFDSSIRHHKEIPDLHPGSDRAQKELRVPRNS
ncbi:MAG: tetratricopeptide repeat protein [Candidatus Binatia bacterium]